MGCNNEVDVVCAEREVFCTEEKDVDVCIVSEQEIFKVKDEPEAVCTELSGVIAPFVFIKRIIDTRINIGNKCTLLMRNPLFTENGQLVIDIEGEALML